MNCAKIISEAAERPAGIALADVELRRPVVSQSKAPRRWLLPLGLALFVTIAGVVGWRWWAHARCWVTTDNATLSGEIHQVSTRVTGTVTEVLVQENQTVTAGQVLARVDVRDFEVHCEQAKAALAQAQAQVTQATAQIERQEAALRRTQITFDRADLLLHQSGGAISQQEFDDAKAALESDRASLVAARAGEAGAKAQFRVAEANVHEADLQLSYTEIKAANAGRIGRKDIEVGNHIQPGQALLALVTPEVWVTANFKETQLRNMHVGQRAVVEVDTFPGHRLTGHVDSFSPASGAKFALLPPDNATGNFTKIVQRVPVKIVLDDPAADGLAGRILPGMSALVSVRVRD